MKSLEPIVAANDAYHDFQHGPELNPAEANALAHVIHNTAPAYHKIGNQVCRELVELIGDDPDYTNGDYYVATYDALSDATDADSISEVSRRALRNLFTQPSLAEMQAAHTAPVQPEAEPQTVPKTLTAAEAGNTQPASEPPQEAAAKPAAEPEEPSATQSQPAPEPLVGQGPTYEPQPEPPNREQLVQADHELCQRVAAGDKEAATQLLAQHRGIIYRYVNAAARLLRGSAMDRDDLYQEACIYMLDRTAKYSTNHNVRFSSFVGAFLDKRLSRIIDEQFAVHVPADIQVTINNIRRDDEKRSGYREGIMDETQVAKDLDMPMGAPTERGKLTTGNIRQAAFLTRFMFSLDEGFGRDDNQNPGSEYAFDARMILKPVTNGVIPQPDQEIENDALLDEITAMLKTLSEREAGIIRLRYGLADGVPRTYEEVGDVYGITRERVRQIESKSMSKLRHPSRSQILKDFLIETDDARKNDLAIRYEREKEARKTAKHLNDLRAAAGIKVTASEGDTPPQTDTEVA
jgi:RNA polymerase sigma factor (sigma-70 family)